MGRQRRSAPRCGFVIGSATALRDVRYAPGSVRYNSMLPTRVAMKLSFEPKSVRVGGRALAKSDKGAGWKFDSKTQVLTLEHGPGDVEVR